MGIQQRGSLARGAGGMGKGPASPTDPCKTRSVLEASSNSGISARGLAFQIYIHWYPKISTGLAPPTAPAGPGQGHRDTTTACHPLEEAEAGYQPGGEQDGVFTAFSSSEESCWEGKDTHFPSKFVPSCGRLPSHPEAESSHWGTKLNHQDGTSICRPAPVEWPLVRARAWGAGAPGENQLGLAAIQLLVQFTFFGR